LTGCGFRTDLPRNKGARCAACRKAHRSEAECASGACAETDRPRKKGSACDACRKAQRSEAERASGVCPASAARAERCRACRRPRRTAAECEQRHPADFAAAQAGAEASARGLERTDGAGAARSGIGIMASPNKEMQKDASEKCTTVPRRKGARCAACRASFLNTGTRSGLTPRLPSVSFLVFPLLQRQETIICSLIKRHSHRLRASVQDLFSNSQQKPYASETERPCTAHRTRAQKNIQPQPSTEPSTPNTTTQPPLHLLIPNSTSPIEASPHDPPPNTRSCPSQRVWSRGLWLEQQEPACVAVWQIPSCTPRELHLPQARPGDSIRV
jgi:hypothetical protein